MDSRLRLLEIGTQAKYEKERVTGGQGSIWVCALPIMAMMMNHLNLDQLSRALFLKVSLN